MSTQGFSFLDLLSNPDFQNLLAGTGAQLGGAGSVGAALGSSTIAFNKARAAQKAGLTTLNRNTPAVPTVPLVPDIAPSSLSATPITEAPTRSPLESLLDEPATVPKLSYSVKDASVLADEVSDLLTPPQQAGPTSIARDKAGAVNVKYTPVQNEVADFLSPYLPPQTTMADLETDYTLGSRRDLRQLASLDQTNDVMALLGPSSAEASVRINPPEPVIPPAVATKLEAHSTKYSTDSNLTKAIALQESGGVHTNPDGSVKVSNKGARGTMQLMPKTAARLGVNADDPEQNLEGGVREIANLQKLSKNPKDILAGYVGGEDGMRLYQSQKPQNAEQKDTLAKINAYVNQTYARYERMQAATRDYTGTPLIGIKPQAPSTDEYMPRRRTPGTVPKLTGIPLVDYLIDVGKELFDVSTPESQADVDAATARRRERERAAGGNKTDPVVPTLQDQVQDLTGQKTPPAEAPKTVETKPSAEAPKVDEPTAKPTRDLGSPTVPSRSNIDDDEYQPPSKQTLRSVVKSTYDLRGLSPDEVDKVVGRALEAERSDIADINALRAAQDIRETDRGYELVNKITGRITPLTRGGKVDGRRVMDQRKKLSAFADSVSEIAGNDAAIRPRMNDSQSKAFEYGSRALQANERQRRLEEKHKDNPNKFSTQRTQILQVLEALPPDTPMTIITQAATALDTLGGYAKEKYYKWLGENPSATEQMKNNYLTALGLGPAYARVMAVAGERLSKDMTQDEREFLENALDFSTAMLRRDSGAAVSTNELLTTYRQYFPVAGDQEPSVKRKMRTRQQVIRGLRVTAGRPLLAPDVDED